MKSILIFDHFLPQIFFLFDTFPMKMNKILKVTKQSAEMHCVVFMEDMCTSLYKDQECHR